MQPLSLCGFASALDALEGNKEPGAYRADSLNTWTRRFGSTPVDLV